MKTYHGTVYERLFGKPFPYTGTPDAFQLLSCYWHYTEIRHPSTSQRGHTHHLKGCRGPLYLKGHLEHLLPLVVLGSELHLGGKLAYGMGYYRLARKPVPHFDARYPTESQILEAMETLRDRYDFPPPTNRWSP